MVDQNRIEIRSNKGKLARLLVISILFLCAGAWLAIKDPQTSNPLFNNVFVKAIGFYGSALMGLFGLIFFTKKLLDSKPAIILDEEGLTDNMSAISLGFILWADINYVSELSIQPTAVSTQWFVVIVLKEPEAYIEREANPIKRMFLKLNNKNYGSPIHLSTNSLDIEHKALYRLIAAHFQKYKELHSA
jgi:hypothetical protein